MVVGCWVGWLSTTHAEAPCGGKNIQSKPSGPEIRKSEKKNLQFNRFCLALALLALLLTTHVEASCGGKHTIQAVRSENPEIRKKHTIQPVLLVVGVVALLLSTTHAEAPCGGNQAFSPKKRESFQHTAKKLSMFFVRCRAETRVPSGVLRFPVTIRICNCCNR